MTILAAGWLWLVVPWSLLAICCWRRVPAEQGVTARFLWRDSRAASASFAFQRVPPAWIVCVLTALLLTILSLAGPAVHRQRTRVAVIIDPSIAMLATIDGRPSLHGILDRIESEIPRNAIVRYRVAGSDEEVTREAARMPRFTARSTDSMLHAAVGHADADVVVVATASDVKPSNKRVMVRSPHVADVNRGITSVSLAPVPIARVRGRRDQNVVAQVMVRVANFGPPTIASLDFVAEPAMHVSQSVDLPAGESTHFVDLPSLPARLDVRLVGKDAFAYDNTATLQRSASWPALAIDGDVPPAATRFAGAFGRERSSDDESLRVSLTTRATDNTAILFASPRTTGELRPISVISDHPLLRDLDLSGLATLRAMPPGEGWTIVAQSDEPVLAVRDRPSRQVWIGVALGENDVRTVVLLANAVEWLSADARPRWRAATPSEIGRDWTLVTPTPRMPDMPVAPSAIKAGPGLYHDAAGRDVAVNVPALSPGSGHDSGDLADAIQASRRRMAVRLDRPLAIGAALLLLFAVWRVAPSRSS